MLQSSVPQRQMETRTKNKTAHPGYVLKPTQCRKKAEVEQERTLKAQAKEACAEAKKRGINRTAEFEHADLINEDMVDATPRPAFAPKPMPSTRNQRSYAPVVGSGNDDPSDVEFVSNKDVAMETESGEPSENDDLGVLSDEIPLPPKRQKTGKAKTVTVDDSAVESNKSASPPIKRRKTHIRNGDSAVESDESSPPAKKQKTGNAQTKARSGTKTAGKRKRNVVSDVETVLGSDVEMPKKPIPKAKVRDEIDIAVKRIVEKIQVKPMLNLKGGSGGPGGPASKAKVAARGKRLEREGVMSNVDQSESLDDKINDQTGNR